MTVQVGLSDLVGTQIAVFLMHRLKYPLNKAVAVIPVARALCVFIFLVKFG